MEKSARRGCIFSQTRYLEFTVVISLISVPTNTRAQNSEQLRWPLDSKNDHVRLVNCRVKTEQTDYIGKEFQLAVCGLHDE